ncbi:hypothetical protein K530_52755 [Streptomyces noursei CCRC 11814]|nr:hypothetical protein K530_52755 [Streptomyces noursei CCRC 11814]
MAGERHPRGGGVDVDDASDGVVDEDRLAEAEPSGGRQPVALLGDRGPVPHDCEGVAVAAVGAAEDP